MLGERRLNVCIPGADLTPRVRERLQAQAQTALRRLPPWLFDALSERMRALGEANLPLIVSPLPEAGPGTRCLSLGSLDGRPAARLRPQVTGEHVDWGQDTRLLVAKAVGYMAAPPADDHAFWDGWAAASAGDGLREKVQAADPAWASESDLGLFLEMLAAYIADREHERWRDFPGVHAFFDGWRQRHE